MIRFRPDGAYLSAGEGNGAITLLDTSTTVLKPQKVATHAGGWDWVAQDAVAGPGGFDSIPGGALQAYNLTYKAISTVTSPWTCSTFFARPPMWVAYLADGKTWSFDCFGRTYPGKVILGISDNLDLIFTDSGNVSLSILDPQSIWHQVTHPQEWQPLPSGGYFSRNYQGCFVGSVWYACGYLATPGGLCVWTPFLAGNPVWLLSADGRDFHPNIVRRAWDGMLLVGSGIDAGETAVRLYELDITHKTFRLNGGWSPLHG